MGLNIAEKQLLKSLEAQEKSGVLDMRPGGKEQLEELREKQGDDKSSIFDKIGIFSTLEAADDVPLVNPNENPSLFDVPSTFGPTQRENVGAMDRETPFGDMVKSSGGNIFSNRQFDNIRAGFPEQGIMGTSVGQRFNIENNPELFFNTEAGKAEADEEEDIFDYLKDLSGGVVDFGKDIAGRTVASQILGMAGATINPLAGLAGLVFGGLKGGDLFKRNPVIADIAQPGNPFGLQMRRDAASISRMLNRQAQGKMIGENRLADIMGKFGLSDVDTDAMSDSISESAQTGYGGFGSAAAASAAAASGGRDYSQSPGAMAGDMEYGEE